MRLENDTLLGDSDSSPQVVKEKTSIRKSSSHSTNADIRADSQPTWYEVLPQIVSSSIALSTAIQAGIALSFSGVLLPQLATDTDIQGFSKVEASWIASMVAITSPLGALFTGPVMDAVGRRATCILACVPLVSSWVLTYFTTKSLTPLYIARGLSGFGSAMTSSALVYTAEVSHDHYRTLLLSLNSVFVAFGILITTVLGVYLEWHIAALWFGLLAFISQLLCFAIPESPYWLANFRSQKINEIKHQVRRLNKPQWMYEKELSRIQDVVRKCQEANNETSRERKGFLSDFKESIRGFSERTSYFPFLLILAIFTLQQMSGTYVVIFYTVNIFQAVKGGLQTGLNEYSATIILGLIRFIAGLVSTGLNHCVGRRPLMIVSSLGMAISCMVASILQYKAGIITVNFDGHNSTNSSFDIKEEVSSAVNWCIMGSILTFVAFGAIGHMVIPWAIISELLPTKIRAVGIGASIAYSYSLMFIIIKTFPFLLDYVALYLVFLMYSVMSFLSAIFVYFCLPETFRKSFVEIMKSFDKVT